MSRDDLTEARPPRPGAVEIAFDVFQRIVALFCLAAGIRYWALLIGVLEQGTWRFDLLPVHWKIAAASLAVLWPVAGIGLWMLVSWGPVIWLVAAATEIAMHGGFPELYGEYWPLLAVHAGVALIYAVFRIALYLIERRRRRAELQ